jgi:hypothetical protein
MTSAKYGDGRRALASSHRESRAGGNVLQRTLDCGACSDLGVRGTL